MLVLLQSIVVETWHILTEAAPYVLLGFMAAGLIKALLPEAMVVRHLGQNTTKAVVKASLLGIPLPLCSCGVLPAAIGLRKQGAGRGPTAAFLVSTPESGVDSIAITWALLDPVMTVIRPIAAFITATITGVLVNMLPEEVDPQQEQKSDCGCDDSCCSEPEPLLNPNLRQRVGSGLGYAFGELLKDIGSWLLLGVVIAGIVTA
ncbi:MAG: permease, partial [Desulfuromonadales bacterium]|nr:permease [Desulfuromonadales bacterium]